MHKKTIKFYIPWESCRARLLFAVAASGLLAELAADEPDVEGLEAAEEAGGAAGDCAVFAAATGGGGGFDGGADGALDADAAADDDVALLAIANTVDAIEGFPSPPPNNDPLDTCLAAFANAPAGFDGPSGLAPLAVGCDSAFISPSGSICRGLHLSLKRNFNGKIHKPLLMILNGELIFIY